MALDRPDFTPDPDRSRAEMESLQREIAAAATFTDNTRVRSGSGASPGKQSPTVPVDDRPLVAGVDQGFEGDRATSGVVVLRGDRVVERVHATERTGIPYVPGLLSFREGGAILSAFQRLDTDPDLVFLDGSGRIHFREAGLATHIGVTLDVPTIGVAKSLLCGQPRESLEDPLPAGARVPIEADEDVTAPNGTGIGYAVQTRQYDSPNRYINPLYVSPGHRVSAATAADLVERFTAGYKLPEPTRLADRYAAELTGNDS
jgi:deoxyribonuclease V